jgi:hypothetical protein
MAGVRIRLNLIRIKVVSVAFYLLGGLYGLNYITIGSLTRDRF